MAKITTIPTGRERTFSPDDIIVSKTTPQGPHDLRQRRVHGGQRLHRGRAAGPAAFADPPPGHAALRVQAAVGHDRVGNEIFAYVNNMAKGGDNYWVFAHVTPTFGPDGSIISYHSSRRVPRRACDRACPPGLDCRGGVTAFLGKMAKAA